MACGTLHDPHLAYPPIMLCGPHTRQLGLISADVPIGTCPLYPFEL